MEKLINAKVDVAVFGQKVASFIYNFIYNPESPLSEEEQIYSNLGMTVSSTEEYVRKVYVLRTIDGKYIGENFDLFETFCRRVKQFATRVDAIKWCEATMSKAQIRELTIHEEQV